MSEPVTMTLDEARALATRALVASNASEPVAASVAAALVAAERDGQAGHGLARVPAYAAQARAGKVDGHAVPGADRVAPTVLRVDAANGFAYPAIDLAIERLPSLARGAGLGAAAISRSHHAGVLGAHVERLARAGLVAIMVANAPRAMAPWGGSRPLYGTNPIAFAAPVEGDEPLVIDLSLSRIARGAVMRAAQRGEAIPEGWALDADGNPTTDAGAALAGTMIPAGGPKGAALALMVEVLAASLTGAVHSADATSFFDAEGPPPGTGQLIIAIDPRATGSDVGARTAALVGLIGEQGARVPGTGRLAKRARAERRGIEVDGDLLGAIRALAGDPSGPVADDADGGTADADGTDTEGTDGIAAGASAADAGANDAAGGTDDPGVPDPHTDPDAASTDATGPAANDASTEDASTEDAPMGDALADALANALVEPDATDPGSDAPAERDEPRQDA